MGTFSEHLKSKSVIQEQAFSSHAPLVGPLIVWFRRMWNSISTRWYVLPLIQQQNEFNAVLLAELREQFTGIEQRFIGIEQRLIDLDRDQTELSRVLAETQYQVIQLRRRVEASRYDAPQDKAEE